MTHYEKVAATVFRALGSTWVLITTGFTISLLAIIKYDFDQSTESVFYCNLPIY